MIINAREFDFDGMKMLCSKCGQVAQLACDDCGGATCGKHELKHGHQCQQKVKVALA